MTKVNKWLYSYVIQGNYGYGSWDDLTAEETEREGLAQLECYRANESRYAHRMIKRREPNPAYKG